MGAIEYLQDRLLKWQLSAIRWVGDDVRAVRELINENASLREREKRLREMLERLEQTGYLASGHCPVCEHCLVLEPHHPDCALNALLKEGE